jgi:hypothetical protein
MSTPVQASDASATIRHERARTRNTIAGAVKVVVVEPSNLDGRSIEVEPTVGDVGPSLAVKWDAAHRSSRHS